MALHIEDYALIGDCRTAALVGRDGSIDWLCWPRFDSPACFGALLGTADHGRWVIAPAQNVVATSRQYRPSTLILETEFQTQTSVASVVDFMPFGDGASWCVWSLGVLVAWSFTPNSSSGSIMGLLCSGSAGSKTAR
jgi:GH15 family glucan-1,4-alpha-glucosidase